VLGNSVVEQNRRDAAMKFLLFARFERFIHSLRETILTELNARSGAILSAWSMPPQQHRA
jgi:hypothetical protein